MWTSDLDVDIVRAGQNASAVGRRLVVGKLTVVAAVAQRLRRDLLLDVSLAGAYREPLPLPDRSFVPVAAVALGHVSMVPILADEDSVRI